MLNSLFLGESLRDNVGIIKFEESKIHKRDKKVSAYKLINESFQMNNFENTNWALDIPKNDLKNEIQEEEKEVIKPGKYLCHSGHEMTKIERGKYRGGAFICDNCRRHFNYPIWHYNCAPCEADYCSNCWDG